LSDQLYLLFAVEEPDPVAVGAVALLVEELNRARAWSLGELAFVNEIDEDAGSEPNDVPVWTVGGALPLSRPSGDLGRERSQFADVEFLIGRLCAWSERGYSLVVEYDNEEIGSITGGVADSSLHDGLLGEWRKALHEP